MSFLLELFLALQTRNKHKEGFVIFSFHFLFSKRNSVPSDMLELLHSLCPENLSNSLSVEKNA